MTLSVLIVDDEELARRQLRRFLSELPDVAVLDECESGLEAVDAIGSLKPDAVFLDVQMPHLDGFGVIDAVGFETMPPVVFVTAFEEHAVRAFRSHAIDYLLKPVDPVLVGDAVARIRERIEQTAGSSVPQLAALVQQLTGTSYLRRIVAREDGRVRIVPLAAIDWIEADDNVVRVHAGETLVTMRITLTKLASRLDPRRFARIHRSRVVNLERVREIQPWFRGEHVAILHDGTRLEVGPTYRDNFLAALAGES